jgi:hypothetical protein
LEASRESILVPNSVVAEIKLLSEIAKTNGSLISLGDISVLTHCDLSEEQLESSWLSNPELANAFELHDRYVIERAGSENCAYLVQREIRKRAAAKRNTSVAREFARLCGDRKIPLIALSGSTSYQSASETDDLDFFVIARSGSLWIFLARALLLARVFRLVRGRVPRICFSYAMDQEFAERAFSTSNDALFARDALTATVLSGSESYAGLLKKSSWISNHFPRLYRRRTSEVGSDEKLETLAKSSGASKFLNNLLWIIVGRYIRAKSNLLNQKFTKSAKPSSLFAVNIGPDHCIFESVRYSNLRTVYEQLAQTRAMNGIARAIEQEDGP